tara:strand:+ start:15 stop:533 length:519 start_codon:yes stop_codon:yes gene_type:complete
MTTYILDAELRDRLKELYYYSNGRFYRTEDRGRYKKDVLVGANHDKRGYRKVSIDDKQYYEHRLVYLYHHGYLPNEIDHMNGIKNDNRVENLRACTRTENNHNKGIQKNNTSGYKGVSFNKSIGKWEVYLWIEKAKKNLGYYSDLELAGLVADEARDKYNNGCTRRIHWQFI